jgi:hypothetical protein
METLLQIREMGREVKRKHQNEAMKPHNTKVFNLCRIKKVGIEKWAKSEASDIFAQALKRPAIFSIGYIFLACKSVPH